MPDVDAPTYTINLGDACDTAEQLMAALHKLRDSNGRRVFVDVPTGDLNAMTKLAAETLTFFSGHKIKVAF